MAQSAAIPSTRKVTRRQFLQASALGTAALAAGAVRGQSAPSTGPGSGVVSGRSASKPNIIFISADQLGIEAISGHGCPDVHTPNIDRLLARGLSFQQCYTAYPLCSPARSSWFTGRMPSETGVVFNDLSIRAGMPTMGEVLRAGGYETFYAGKWHLPHPCTNDIPGFDVLPSGITMEGQMGDTAVSQACQALLRNRRSSQPFLLVTSFVQPHDICQWVEDRRHGRARPMAHGLSESSLPALPPNFNFKMRQPKELPASPRWTPLQWRYYLWCYYRHVEMVDAEIGRVLDAIESSPATGNTLVLFASDHGEGQARHKRVLKNFFYDEACRVPLIVSWPGRIAEKARDANHLISSTDFLPTFCDYAGVAAPAGVVGRSLRPLLEGNSTSRRDMVAAEVGRGGRMIRTQQYKLITYRNDPIEQLFDMTGDPWEKTNLADDDQYASVMADHHKILADWESRLDVAPSPQVKKRKAPAENDSE